MPTWNGGAPGATGRWDNTTWSSTFSFGGLSTRSAGARWASVTIPQGAVIDAATLAFTLSGEANSGRAVGVHQVDNAPALGNGQRGTDNTPTVEWASGGGAKTVSVVAAIQALVDRPGWASGNALTVRWDGLSFELSDRTLSAVSLSVDWHDPFTNYERTAEDAVGVVDAAGAGAGWARDGADTVGIADAAEHLMPTVRDGFDTAAVSDAAVATLIPGISRGAADSVPVLDQVAASIVRFDPPPPPWQDVISDPEYIEAITALHRDVDWRAEIINPSGVVLSDPLPFIDGQLVVDAERDHRWSVSFIVPDQAWYPWLETDPLHPHSRHRIQLWFQLFLPRSQRWVEIPCGRFHPRVGDAADDADAPPLEFDVTGVSALGTIRHYLVPIDVSGMRAHTAIDTILAAVAPTLPRDLTPSMHSLPAEYIVGEPHDGDPVADMHEIAAAAGMVLYEDRVGVIRLDPIPDATPMYDWTQNVVQRISVRGADITQTVNTVMVSSTSSEVDPPVHAIAQIIDPEDPISVTHGVYYPLPVPSDKVRTEAQAGEYAVNQLILRREGSQQLDLVTSVQAHVDALEVAVLDHPRAVGPRRVTGWSVNLNPESMMAVTMRGAVDG
ncbi:hypothetical protein [Microbacterium sp. No. 7]|uniref:hypothetical protein n=1 Tax=Microbacterium sp. No. 7 TaxID=1714373 RepID=UPI0006D08ED7|nr:hypothetical protein [Microbacterium sp. No. 7]ALJ22037.1 hypothetical protein AOA12_19935 [Microbacterium sp. No. 7]